MKCLKYVPSVFLAIGFILFSTSIYISISHCGFIPSAGACLAVSVVFFCFSAGIDYDLNPDYDWQNFL